MNIAKVKEKPSVSKSAKEMVQTAPKELLRRGFLDGTEKLRGQLRDTAEGGQREEDVSDHAHSAATQGTRFAADKLGRLAQSGRKNRDKISENHQETPSTVLQGEDFWESPSAPSKESHVKRSTSSITAEQPTVQPQTEPVRIKTRETASSTSPVAPHTRTTASAPNQPMIKTRQDYIQHQAGKSKGTSFGTQSQHGTDISKVHFSAQTQTSPLAQAQSREKYVRDQCQDSAVRQAAPNTQDSAVGDIPEPVRGRGAKNISARNAPLSKTDIQTGTKADIRPAGKGTLQTKVGIKGTEKVSPVQIKAPRSSMKTAGQTTHQTIKTVEHTSRKTVKTAERGAKAAKNGIKAAQKTAQTAVKARRWATQAARATTKTAATSAKAVTKAAVSAIKAAISAAQELAAAIGACGGAVVAVLLILCLVAAFVMSPLGVFLSGEENGGPTMVSVIREINLEYEAKVEQLKEGITCDEVNLSGSRAPWPEILAVYAVKTTSYPTNGQEVVTMDDAKKELLKQVFWDMNDLSSFTSTVPGGEGEEDTTTLYITVTAKTADEMADVYDFDANQRQQLAELLSSEYQELWNNVLYGIGTGDGEIVAVALSQVGNIGGQPYWSWYGFAHRVDWCAIFVSWCANECGYIGTGAVPKFSGCVQGAQWFKDRGLWQDRSNTPNPGDIIFFDWDDPGGFSGPQDGVSDHVGIVERVENGRVYTVEGNSGDKCVQRSYPVGYYQIYGYGVICS